jgi:UDP-3-O-[3-hydroxymyristoyl] glucosamine N-acyltransferase
MDETGIFLAQGRLTVGELCEVIGNVKTIRGNPELVISSLAALDCGAANSITFCRFTGDKAYQAIKNTKCDVIVCGNEQIDIKNKTLIHVNDPRAWFIEAIGIIKPQKHLTGIHSTALISQNSVIGEGVTIGPFAVIEDGAVIKAGSTIGSLCHISGAATIGKRVQIQSHSVIGSVGLAYHEINDGSDIFFPHLGRAIIKDDTTIGTHTTIVRGILKNTEIGAHCRIGNHVNIAHNCMIGDRVFVSSTSTLAGGARIGHRTRIAAGVSVTANCVVGSNAHIGLGSAVIKNLENNKRVIGNPARPLPTMRDF